MKTQNEIMKFLHDNAIEQIMKDAESNGRTLSKNAIAYMVRTNSKAGKEIVSRYAEYMTIGYKALMEVA